MLSMVSSTRKHTKKAKHIRAIELRCEGLTARAAVTRLNKDFPKDKTSIETYNGWFKRDGLLYQEYAEFIQNIQQETRQRLSTKLHEAADEALDVLITQVKTKGRYRRGLVAQQAASKILERVIGKPDEDNGKIVVVKLVDPVKPEDVPPGYLPSGEPITTVQDAVDAADKKANIDEIKHQLLVNSSKAMHNKNP